MTKNHSRTSNSRGGLVYNIHSPMPSSADNAISNLLYANTTGGGSSNASSSTNSPNLGKGGGTLESNVSSGFDELDIGDSIGSAALEGRDKIMQANVYCIHKVGRFIIVSHKYIKLPFFHNIEKAFNLLHLCVNFLVVPLHLPFS